MKGENTMNEFEMEQLLNKAIEEGRVAGRKLNPKPMVVNDGEKNYFVPDGLCGFAWIIVKPGNSKFANFLKKKEVASKDYYGGVNYWVQDFNQSIGRKQAFAGAFAGVLVEAGINAYADSRLD